MLKKLAYKKEPKLQVHKYVVAINYRLKSGVVHTKFHYCLNLKEVREASKKSKKGSWIEVYLASHNFVQGYANE